MHKASRDRLERLLTPDAWCLLPLFYGLSAVLWSLGTLLAMRPPPHKEL